MLLFEKLFVGLHLPLRVVLAMLKDHHSHLGDVIPRCFIMKSHVFAHTFRQLKHVAHSTINIRCVRISVCTEQVRQPVVRIVRHEIPDLLVRAVLYSKGSLFVFNSSNLERIIKFLLLIFLLVSGGSQLHSGPFALLYKIFLNTPVNALNVQHGWACLVGLQHNVVFNIFEYLVVDSAQGSGTSQPNIFPFLTFGVVVLPDPGSAISSHLTLEECLNFRLFNDFWVKFDFLALLGELNRWQLQFELFFFLFREASLFSIHRSFLLLFVVAKLAIIDITNVEHAEESSELGNGYFFDNGVVRIVQIGILQCTVVDHLMNLIVEFELIALEFISGKDCSNVVLAHKLINFPSHFSVFLDVV